MELPLLDPLDPHFPPPSAALNYPDGLLAAGGNLSEETLIKAYQRGIFPWYQEGQPILWWSPDPRAVIFPNQLHLSKSLRKALRKGGYQISSDQAFDQVITACAEPRAGHSHNAEGNHTWISQDMIAAYQRLFQRGHAHSVEYWLDGKLMGGLYGIVVGNIFCGESMFSRASNASKIAFAHLASALHEAGFQLIDCQIENNHLSSLGAVTISRDKFCDYLKKAELNKRDWPAHLISSNISDDEGNLE